MLLYPSSEWSRGMGSEQAGGHNALIFMHSAVCSQTTCREIFVTCGGLRTRRSIGFHNHGEDPY